MWIFMREWGGFYRMLLLVDMWSIVFQTYMMKNHDAEYYLQARKLILGYTVNTDDGRYVHPLNSLNQNISRGAKIGARIKLQKRTCRETELVHTSIFK